MDESSKVEIESSEPQREETRLAEQRAPGFPIRVDAPHSQPTSSVVREPAYETVGAKAGVSRPISVEPDSGIDIRLVAPAAQISIPDEESPERYSLETEQIASHLRKQYSDVDRREQRLHAQMALLDQERREHRLWMREVEAGLEERELAIAQQEAEFTVRAENSRKLEIELKELQASLLRERHTLNLEREQLILDREEQTQAIEGLRARNQAEMERLRSDLLAEQQAAEAELKQRGILLDSRHRFQQDHLQRTMQDFEKAQNAFRYEQQAVRTREEQFNEQIRLRSRQIERKTQLLDERQQSIERERLVLVKERRILEERLAVDAEGLRRERAAWEQDRDTQKADVRRQQDLLTSHAENLEARRQRLDNVRIDLEETNRQILELRLAVEESAAQLMQTAGTEATRQKIDEAHAVLAEYYRHTRDSIVLQRQEVEQSQLRVQEQRAEFRNERKTLVDWVAQQEEQLNSRELALRAERDAADHRDAERQAALAHMTAEKLKAESIIRDLLQQLAARESD